jgi:multicomponent K+:H+ antiporter subunit A
VIALLPFLGALVPGVMIRAGRTACASFTAMPTALALVMLLVLSPAVMRGEVIKAEVSGSRNSGFPRRSSSTGSGFSSPS